MSIWSEEKVSLLRQLWGTGVSARVIAEKMGPGFTRNSIIGKASRLGLSAKLKTRTTISNTSSLSKNNDNQVQRRGRRSKFRSLLLDKDFEPENPKQLEELENGICRWPIGHPDEESFYFCGRSSFKIGNREMPYCKLHLLYAYQSKDKKEDLSKNGEEEIPKFIEKKVVKSA